MKLKLNTACINELIILILASTFSVDTPNKLPAFPAVNPVIKSPTANTASAINAVLAPKPILVNTAVIFLVNLASILSAFLSNALNAGSTNCKSLVPILAAFGNFSIAFLANTSTASLPTVINFCISPPLEAAPSTPSPITLATALPEPDSTASLASLASAKFITLPVPFAAPLAKSSPPLAALAAAKSITLETALPEPDSAASLAALAAAKSITLSAVPAAFLPNLDVIA